MKAISCKRHCFPAAVIRQAVWLYFRFALSFRMSTIFYETPWWFSCSFARSDCGRLVVRQGNEVGIVADGQLHALLPPVFLRLFEPLF